MTDKQVQFPPLLEENLPGTSRDVNFSPALNLEDGLVMQNATEVVDPFLSHNIGHSSVHNITLLPSFNSMNVQLNEQLKKHLPSTSKLPDLKRSRISFDGKTCVREFITSVEEYFLYKNFDENFLVGSFSDLLTGTAAKWFRSIRIRVSSWTTLKSELLNRFDKPEFDYHLEYEMRTRKQRSNESLPDFITDILDMSSRLANPTFENVLITIIKHNMLPIYTPFLFGKSIDTIEQFIRISKELEILVNRKPVKEIKQNFHAVETKLSCLKCKSTDHTYKECTEILGPVCFKCHKRGVLTKNCDTCHSDNIKNNNNYSKNL